MDTHYLIFFREKCLILPAIPSVSPSRLKLTAPDMWTACKDTVYNELIIPDHFLRHIHNTFVVSIYLTRLTLKSFERAQQHVVFQRYSRCFLTISLIIKVTPQNIYICKSIQFKGFAELENFWLSFMSKLCNYQSTLM